MNQVFMFYAVIAFISGMVVGSFLNVVIYRLPRGESLMFPSSHCPNCHKSIAFYDNIPIFSYLILGGKCRKCKNSIGKIYPIIEFVTAVLFVLAFMYRGNNIRYMLDIYLISVLICIFMIDLNNLIIPNELNIALAIGAVAPIIFGYIAPVYAMTGAVIGGAVLFVIAVIGPMGGGDIKFMAAMGLWLGTRGTLLALWLAFVIGGVIGVAQLILKKKKRGESVAFGPYLIIGSLLAYFFQDIFFEYYLRMF